MVKAILEGRKTKTRRVITPDFTRPILEITEKNGLWKFEGDAPTNYGGEVQMNDWTREQRCPYGKPGDRLWVKETFHPMPHLNSKAYFRATDPLVGGKWTPSIYMPRSLSRIDLEVTRVDVERLREMSNEDAQAEGIQVSMDEHSVNLFADLWDSINAKRGYGWENNPWVWVIEFEKL